MILGSSLCGRLDWAYLNFLPFPCAADVAAVTLLHVGAGEQLLQELCYRDVSNGQDFLPGLMECDSQFMGRNYMM